MILVVDTQYCENYGAYDWDGKGARPQYWKMKGGSSFKITNVPAGVDPEEIIDMVRGEIEHKSDYSEEYIIGWALQEDGWLSEFEQAQMDYDGTITFKEPVIDLGELNSRCEDPREYSERSADEDAIYYGA